MLFFFLLSYPLFSHCPCNVIWISLLCFRSLQRAILFSIWYFSKIDFLSNDKTRKACLLMVFTIVKSIKWANSNIMQTMIDKQHRLTEGEKKTNQEKCLLSFKTCNELNSQTRGRVRLRENKHKNKPAWVFWFNWKYGYRWKARGWKNEQHKLKIL